MDFVIADLHFGDLRTEGTRRRLLPGTDNIGAEIERRWNAVVGEDDTVFVLGDIGRSGLAAIRQLAGRKHLIAGNADNLHDAIVSGVFASIKVARWTDGLLLTHLPVHPSQLRGVRLNIHGHLHGRSIDDMRYRCVSLEQTGFAPLRLDLIQGAPGAF